MDKIRFFVVNANDWYNKGDVTNRLGLILALKRVFGKNIEIYIESLTPIPDKKYFERFDGVKIVKSIFAVSSRKKISTIILQTIRNLVLFLVIFLLSLIFPQFKKIPTKKELENDKRFSELLENVRLNVSLFRSSDIIISSPGGFLHDAYPHILLVNLLPLLLALLLKKPLVIYNQSIGPFKSRDLAKLTKTIVCKANIIAVRETISYETLAEKCKPIVTADATFAIRSYVRKTLQTSGARNKKMKKILEELSLLKEKHVLIGLTIVGYYVLHKGRNIFLRYIDFLGQSLRKINEKMLSKKLSPFYLVIPQNSNDYELALIGKIVEILKRKYGINNIIMLEYDYWPEEILSILNHVDLLIASRMHSAIFASLLAKPVIMLAYQPKFYGISKMLKLNDFVFDISKISKQQIETFTQKVLYIFENSSKISQILNHTTKNLEKKSMLTALLIRKTLFKEDEYSTKRH